MLQHFTLVGSGLYLPQRKLTAEDIDLRAGLALGWTRDHVGVLERYECAPPETLASMGQEAISAALGDAGVGWADIDLILDASTTRHQPIPCNAAYLQSCIGSPAAGIPCMDIQSTCLGFIAAMNVANALFAAGTYRHILIVCSEAALMGVDWSEPESACLMGDGAAAVVLRRADPTPTLFFAHQTFGQYLDTCQIAAGGHRVPPNQFTPETETAFRFHMDGAKLLRTVYKRFPPMLDALLSEANMSREDLHVIPHQAAPKALLLLQRFLDLHPDRFYSAVEHMGNIVAAGVPAVLHECRGDGVVKAGDMLMLLGTSAGYSQAGLIFQL